MELASTAQVTIDRLTPAQVRIAMREGGGGVLSFVVFVLLLAAASYALTPEARAQPVYLVGFLAVALGWLRAELYEVSATDPLTFLAAAAVLAAIAALATLVPARRATAIDPVRALQAD